MDYPEPDVWEPKASDNEYLHFINDKLGHTNAKLEKLVTALYWTNTALGAGVVLLFYRLW